MGCSPASEQQLLCQYQGKRRGLRRDPKAKSDTGGDSLPSKDWQLAISRKLLVQSHGCQRIYCLPFSLCLFYDPIVGVRRGHNLVVGI
jgi:hypothetical protein